MTDIDRGRDAQDNVMLSNGEHVDLIDKMSSNLRYATALSYVTYKAHEAEPHFLNQMTAQTSFHLHELIDEVLTCFERLEKFRVAMMDEADQTPRS